MDSITRIKEFIRNNFPDWTKVDFSTIDDNINFREDWSDLYEINNEEVILISYTNISITGTERLKPQLRVFLDEYKKPFLYAKKHNLRFYLFSIYTKEDEMARGLNNFNPKEYIISIETNLDTEGSRRDLRSIYDYANEKLNGRKFLKCSHTNYKADINQASFIYIGTPEAPEKETFESFINIFDSRPYLNSKIDISPIQRDVQPLSLEASSYLPYLTALRTKPFMLLAGISGTGKSRIVREMAKACWASGEEDYGKHCPRNFCMVQVKPNWHDSSELIGYVSRINGEKYIIGPFLRFIAQALKEPQRPYFLCLDEMNLAPVEQYFAEFLSVIESRKLQDGQIVTDPIVPYENTEAYGSLIDQLFELDKERKAYKTEKIEDGGKRLTIPQNLFVVGTVNMDETTFSFSRKVLDRAMTIEMNEVKLDAGLNANSGNELGYIGSELMGQAVEGRDIYADNQPMCDKVIAYLQKVNEVLDATPFKIAYRTRNEFLLYAVNRKTFAPESELWQTLDEMTSMKILSRIEGDTERCEKPLRGLEALLKETLGDHTTESVSLRKIEEMTRKLQSGYTSYWT